MKSAKGLPTVEGHGLRVVARINRTERQTGKLFNIGNLKMVLTVIHHFDFFFLVGFISQQQKT